VVGDAVTKPVAKEFISGTPSLAEGNTYQRWHVGWATPGRHGGTNLSDQPIDLIAAIPEGAHP
jgi:hypothetical protein